ncbi:sensor domain-containing protein [Paeniglutamicibacter sp. R2-26]|uniref:sensor domain-containing protein n=1 Tax=Paeniglutamicibacter sp. R2-26 TaxID=3144417 RepID=UPI003EE59667
MSKNALLPLTLAAMLALAGCASGGAQAGSPSSSAGGKSTAAASPSAGSPAKAAQGTQLDGQTLADIAQEIAGDSADAQVADEASMRAQLPATQEAMKSMKIEPAECASMAAGDPTAEFDKMNMVSLVLPGATLAENVQVGIASYADPADAEANIAQNRKTLKDCPKFTMVLQGEKVATTVTKLNAATRAAVTEANRSVVSVSGAQIPTVAVSALDGHNLVSVSVTGGTDQAEDIAQAEDLVNTVLAAIEDKAS